MPSDTPKSRGRPAKYTTPLCNEVKLRLSEELLVGLDWLAARENCTRAEAARTAIGTVVRLAQFTDSTKP